ncbi:SDR family NAD(P)-dependent oxidoreductase [Geomonas sp. RF6]|uniref:SDR family NAD(P)-dependent oxidoreductase n=1 Tax=Geomonas sp. RF6 TaxID=2897342 RepID=UPI001E42921F|nr:SDR family NAD(P)-dependent oxidoreductase [Geomonas sp. RF6]UFS69346.1 SDR family NAD(P)-dependent oxidoreductase [Geomonas sp. RF6]
MYQGEHVLVTGAGGFIGSHLVERLVREGGKVRAFVRYNSRGDAGMLRLLDSQVRREVETVAGDLRDSDAVRKAVQGCRVVFHLGALIAIPYSYLHPREVVDTNVIGTLNVLEACRDSGVERMVHTSTSEVYGTARYAPIDEKHPLQGQSPYSASKIAADKLCESFHAAFSLPVATLRPFNTFGPRQSGRAVIPTITSQLLSGGELRLGNLTPTRDYTFVSDTVDGFVRIARCDAAVGRAVNVGSGAEISIGGLAEKLAGIVGREVDVVLDRQRVRPAESEVNRLLANNALALELFGWQPRVSLDEGLNKVVDWVRDNLGNYRVGQYEV